MTDFFESENFVLPSEIKNELQDHLKESKSVKSLEFSFKGDDLKGAREFGTQLLALRKKGVKISNEFTIRLEFTREIPRQKMLELVDSVPRPVNGFMKVRLQMAQVPPQNAAVKKNT
jgi:hypothetical protein